MAPLAGYEPEIGRWLWALEDVRRVLKRALQGVTQAELDYQPPGSNGVGTLLYHIALVEADWLYTEVLETALAPEVKALLPHDARAENGTLAPVKGDALETHLHRLEVIRLTLLRHFQGMTLEQWRTRRDLPEYTVTPEWVIYHLVEHEAHHRGQIADLLRTLRSQAPR